MHILNAYITDHVFTFHQTDPALVRPVASNTLSDQSTVSGIQMITNNNHYYNST